LDLINIDILLCLIKTGQAEKAASTTDSVITSRERVLSYVSSKTEETQF